MYNKKSSLMVNKSHLQLIYNPPIYWHHHKNQLIWVYWMLEYTGNNLHSFVTLLDCYVSHIGDENRSKIIYQKISQWQECNKTLLHYTITGFSHGNRLINLTITLNNVSVMKGKGWQNICRCHKWVQTLEFKGAWHYCKV